LGLAVRRLPRDPFPEEPGLSPRLAVGFFLSPKNRHFHNGTSKMMSFLQETVKLQEKKERTKNAI